MADSQYIGKTKTYIVDVSDIKNPKLKQRHYGATDARPRNQYIKDGVLYQANSKGGMRVLEFSAEQLQEVGFFDTYPSNNDNGNDGVMVIFPFFNDIVILSSRQEGLFVVQPVFPTPTDRPNPMPKNNSKHAPKSISNYKSKHTPESTSNRKTNGQRKSFFFTNYISL